MAKEATVVDGVSGWLWPDGSNDVARGQSAAAN
jgi:hypothetical protein